MQEESQKAAATVGGESKFKKKTDAMNEETPNLPSIVQVPARAQVYSRRAPPASGTA